MRKALDTIRRVYYSVCGKRFPCRISYGRSIRHRKALRKWHKFVYKVAYAELEFEMVSIKDVAKQAGVAISTVSKVLNGYPGVSEATKRKVEKAAEELHFVPNSIAAALSSKQAGRIALLINLNTRTKAIDEIDMQYIAGAIQKAQELKLDLITVFFSMLKGKSVSEIIRYFQAQSIEGIIVYGIPENDKVLWELVEAGVFKMVLVDMSFHTASVSCIGIDHRQAQIDVARKTILENNSKKIFYIAGKKNSYPGAERLKGMEELAQELSCKLFVRYGDFSELKARNLTFQYAKNRDVIVCGSDLMAIGAMRALIEMDIFRPVCGFDGLVLMGYAGKQMNTVQQNFAGVSAAAVGELQLLLQGGEGREVILPHTIKRMKYLDIIA